MDNQTVDKPHDDDSSKDKQDEVMPILPWSEYFKPALMTQLLHKKFGMFGGIMFLYYVIQFICCVAACNFYSDASRNNACTLSNGTKISGEEASQVLDVAIKLTGIFHVMEWIRTTILLTVICIGVNLMHVWYVSTITALYGIAVFIYLIYVYASDAGRACG